MSDPLHVLFVCSANLCRSVTAAELARQRLRENSAATAWEVDSAGTEVMPGNRVPTEVARAMERLDIPPRERPVAVTESSARWAHLILTAERHHRATLARRYPFAVRYTFTLLEFARLVDAGRSATAARPNAPRDLRELARLGRSYVSPIDDSTIDVADPVAQRSAEAMIACAATIDAAIGGIIGRLA